MLCCPDDIMGGGEVCAGVENEEGKASVVNSTPNALLYLSYLT
jgi:hypothetical protein